MDGKHLNGINSLHVNSLGCVRVKGGESECFRIDSGVRQGCIVYPWDAVIKVKMGMGRIGVRFLEEREGD